MLSETAVGSVAGTRAVYQENADHTVESAIPLPDVLTDIPNEPTTAPLPAIDTEKFTAVSEHGGSLKEALQRFKDDPELPLPRCVRDLGFTSTNQLIQRFEGTDDPTKRAPTIKELREAKKREAEQQAAPTAPAEKPKVVKATRTDPTTKAESTTDKQAEPAIGSDTPTPAPVTKQTVSSVAHTAEKSHPLTEQPAIEPDPITKFIKKGRANIPDSEVQTIQYQQTLAGNSRRTTEVEQLLHQALSTAENITDTSAYHVPTTVSTTAPETSIRPEKHIELTSKATPEGLMVETAGDNPDHLLTNENGVESSIEFEAIDLEDITFDRDEIVAELGFEFPALAIDSVIEEPTLITMTEAGPTHTEVFEPDTETSPGEESLELAADTIINLRQSTAALTEATTTEARQPLDMQSKLHEYIQSLEPDKAVAAETALTKLVEALHTDSIDAGSDEEKSAVEIKEIEHLSVTLLDALNLDNKEASVKRLLQELFTPELLTKMTEDDQLSIDQRNHLGTHEYKPAATTSLFAGLVHMIKQHIESSVRLGRYALSASAAEIS